MSSGENSTHSTIQAKVFDFALTELVRQHRDSFRPLWTVDSWVKFLIWMTLNCGLSGERSSLELFAQGLGPPLTSRMRKIFFERQMDKLSLYVLADPAEPLVLVMPLSGGGSLTCQDAWKALEQAELSERVITDMSQWEVLNAMVAIPWQSLDTDS